MYIILGMGTAGYFAAKRLKEAGRKITLVDIKPERTDALREIMSLKVILLHVSC
jgi:Trk K+ transport system NAD-binding subunit